MNHSLRVLVVGPTPPPEGGMAGQCATLARMLRLEGVDAKQLSTSPSLGPLSLAERVSGLRTLLRALAFWKGLLLHVRNADVIHVLGASHLYFFLCVAPAVVAGRWWGKRVILNYRGGAAKEFFARWPRFVRWVSIMADRVIVPSKFLVEVFEEIGVAAAVVPNIIDGGLFSFQRRERLKPRLLVTRNFEPIYDVETAILAFAGVQKLYPEAALTCAGSGPLEASLKERVSTLGLRNVSFVGRIPHEKMGALYEEADIFLNPSTVDNSPNSILEAFAAGTPVVTTNVGGVSYLVRDGENGVLVPPRDPESMAAAVIRLLHDPQLGIALAEGGRRSVEGFTWPAVRRRLYAAYDWEEEVVYA